MVRRSLLALGLLLLIASLALVHAAALQPGEGAEFEWRQSDSSNSWLCANWVPTGLQTNMCRVFCFLFYSRLPSSNTTGCSSGSCDCA